MIRGSEGDRMRKRMEMEMIRRIGTEQDREMED